MAVRNATAVPACITRNPDSFFVKAKLVLYFGANS
jgi:hypothetical protein